MKPGDPAPVEFGLMAVRRERYSVSTLSATSVGMEMGISVVLGLLGGYYLDRHFGTSPWFLLSLMMLGLIAGFRGVVRAMHRADREAARV